MIFAIGIGAVVGVAAAAVQVALLRYGRIPADGALVYWSTYALVGAVLTCIIGFVALKIGAGSRLRAALAGGALAAMIFAIVGPLNLRDLPDVYLLVTDTTRADHLSLYGYERETTPFLEEFAHSAVVFRNSVSQASHTIVSTPCILASCFPSDHGMRFSHHVLPGRLKLISEYLQENGYRTYGYAANPHVGKRRGYDQGFDRYDHHPGWTRTRAGKINRKFLEWFDAIPTGPRFAFLFYIDPHNPYTPPPKFQQRFDTGWKETPIANWDRTWNVEERPDELASLVSQYDGAIAYWDDELRKLVAGLQKRGVYDDALIVYTSDHGEEFFEHGNWGHNRTLYEESIHVPLVMSFPVPIRFPPLARSSGEVTEVVSGVDVLPTILDFLGIEPEPGVRGRSVLDVALGGRDSGPERVAYCEEILGDYGPYDVRGIRTRDHKYIRILDYEGDRSQGDRFFDLRADRSELADLSGGDEAEVPRLRELLEGYMTAVASVEREPNETRAISPKARERLEALGYVTGDD